MFPIVGAVFLVSNTKTKTQIVTFKNIANKRALPSVTVIAYSNNIFLDDIELQKKRCGKNDISFIIIAFQGLLFSNLFVYDFIWCLKITEEE